MPVDIVEALRTSPLLTGSPLEIVTNVVVALAFVVVAGAIVIDFRNYYRQDRPVVGADRSLVETGTMALFFVGYYLIVRFHLGEILVPRTARLWLLGLGLALVVIGVATNVWGRLTLKNAWANQIRIYEGQRLLTQGPFRVVRHPLYASLIWTFIGGALVYANPLSLVATLGVFLPMMVVRARKEDALLVAHFGEEYAGYRARTGMFFPKLGRRP